MNMLGIPLSNMHNEFIFLGFNHKERNFKHIYQFENLKIETPDFYNYEIFFNGERLSMLFTNTGKISVLPYIEVCEQLKPKSH